ncbi:MAG: DUF3313 domain-containing protein [Desulfobulbaceae bacterium]|jgi:hypothetical protein|nr:DUF3313 domain-containing protein [Desulfobulbaceae bacterium]
MKKKQYLTTGLLVALSCCVFSGCASTSTVGHSGFLKDYPTFQPGAPDGVDLVYLKPGTDLKKYNKVMLDKVQFFIKKDADYKGIEATELAELTDTFHRAIIDAMGTAYPLVDKPGPDVLHVRLGVSDIEPSNPALSGLTTVLPVGLAVSAVKKGASGSHTGVGGASMEVEFLDSISGERLGAAIDTFNGSKLSGLSKYGAAKEAFEFWAKRLRVTLDKAHGKAAQ